jgi:hypothetical protein
MQTGSISFCDTYALNIKSESIKKFILNKIEQRYGFKILQKHFEIYNDTTVAKLTKNPHLMSLKSNGNPYFMFLTCINNINTCLIIDKKIQQGYFYPRMIIVHMMFDDVLFKDTLLDGEMLKTQSGDWIYLLNDIVVYKGEVLSNINLIKRTSLLHDILMNKFIDIISPFEIQVKKYFNCCDIDKLSDFKNSLPYTSRGIIFTPLFLKFRKVLYNFDDSLIKSTKRTKLSTDNEFFTVDKKPAIVTNIITKPIVQRKSFKIKYSGNPDVYQLYDLENKNLIGFACVNSLSVSKMLSDKFKDTTLQCEFNVECIFKENFNKWMPISIY